MNLHTALALVIAVSVSGPGLARDNLIRSAGVWDHVAGDDPDKTQSVASCGTDAAYADRAICFAFSCQSGAGGSLQLFIQRDFAPSLAFPRLLFDGREFFIKSGGIGKFESAGDGVLVLRLGLTPAEIKEFADMAKTSETFSIPLGHMFGGTAVQEFAAEGLGELIDEAYAECAGSWSAPAEVVHQLG